MSRIYDALKTAKRTRSTSGAGARESLGVMEGPEKRRSRRWELDVPLTVYGRGPTGSPFYKEADAVNGSADGGLIALRGPVCEGQDLLLINNWTSKEQVCQVVRVQSRDAETNEVGVAFPSPNPEFWEIPDVPCNPYEEPSDEGF
jgi:hypothetical protein